jgi:hypothetical protein
MPILVLFDSFIVAGPDPRSQAVGRFVALLFSSSGNPLLYDRGVENELSGTRGT